MARYGYPYRLRDGEWGFIDLGVMKTIKPFPTFADALVEMQRLTEIELRRTDENDEDTG